MTASEYPYYTELRKEHLSEWRIWYRMIYRCRHDLKYYVETEVCEQWQGAEGFIQWLDDMGPRPSEDMVMDRINKFGNYEPGNVQWVSKQHSADNQRRHDSEERCRYGKIARANGIKRHTYYARLGRGWNYKDAATLKPAQHNYKDRIV
jgi:hypothetical protein